MRVAMVAKGKERRRRDKRVAGQTGNESATLVGHRKSLDSWQAISLSLSSLMAVRLPMDGRWNRAAQLARQGY